MSDSNDEILLDKKFCELFDRMREQEAHSREQNVKLDALIEKYGSYTEVTDKFFEMWKKRDEDDKKRDEADRKEWNERFDKLWKLVVYLCGVLVALALGPKAIDKLVASWKQTPSIAQCEALPMSDRFMWLGFINKETEV